MSASYKRMEELLQRWVASVELHLRYLKLDDAAYARAEDWPEHQRPNALVVTLARTRLLELKAHLVERRDAGDSKFAESLELMSFLTSLLGSEHIERFIPLATGKPPDTGLSGTIEQPRARAGTKPVAHQSSRATTSGQTAARTSATGTAQKSSTGNHGRPARAAATAVSAPPAKAATASNRTADPSRTPRETVSRQLVAARPRPAPADQTVTARAPSAPTPPPRVSDAMVAQVLADATRMLEWGREWPAVAGLIARMADRPSETEIWKILRAHRAEILAKSHRGAS